MEPEVAPPPPPRAPSGVENSCSQGLIEASSNRGLSETTAPRDDDCRDGTLLAIDSCNFARYAAASRLQPVSRKNARSSDFGLDATCSPWRKLLSVAPCCTRTSPSITATRDPLLSALTRKMVLTTDTFRSGVC